MDRCGRPGSRKAERPQYARLWPAYSELSQTGLQSVKRLLAPRALETPPSPKHMGGRLGALQDAMLAPMTTSTGPGGARTATGLF